MLIFKFLSFRLLKMSLLSDKKKNIKETKEHKIPKESKAPKAPKLSRKKITIKSILNDDIHTTSNISISSPINNISDYSINKDMEQILQEINDSEIAIALDTSYASNIAMQLNTMPIVKDMKLIIKEIQDKELLEEDSKFARSLLEKDIYNIEDNKIHGTQQINVKDNEYVFNDVINDVDDNEDYIDDDNINVTKDDNKNEIDNENLISSNIIKKNTVVNNIENLDRNYNCFNRDKNENNFGIINGNEEDITDILEQIKQFEESEKKQSEKRQILEQQDFEYEEKLRQDIQSDLLRKSNIKTSLQINMPNVPNVPNVPKDIDKIEEIDDNPNSKEDITDILEQIRQFEESEKKKFERRQILEQQDFEYEETLHQDIQPDLLRKSNIKTSLQTNILNVPKNIHKIEEIDEIEEIDDKPKSKEDLRKARLAFFDKKI